MTIFQTRPTEASADRAACDSRVRRVTDRVMRNESAMPISAATSAAMMMMRSVEEPVDMTTDGHTVCALAPQGRVRIGFEEGKALLAQPPGATFYHRLRDKFGRLSY